MQRAIASTTDGQYSAFVTNSTSTSFLDVVACSRCNNFWWLLLFRFLCGCVVFIVRCQGNGTKPHKDLWREEKQREGPQPVLLHT